jgi:hypothetical protein
MRRKVTTIRLISNVKVGDLVDIIAGDLKVGTAIVENVEVKKLRDLTDVDAINDGYNTKEELIKDLLKIYGKKVSSDSEVKIIHFKLLS